MSIQKNEAAARQIPVVSSGGAVSSGKEGESRASCETRMQAAVVMRRRDETADPYADMPCTD